MSNCVLRVRLMVAWESVYIIRASSGTGSNTKQEIVGCLHLPLKAYRPMLSGDLESGETTIGSTLDSPSVCQLRD